MMTPEPTAGGHEVPEPLPAGPVTAAAAPRAGRVWAFAMAGAVAAGLAAFAIGEAFPAPFAPPVNMERFMGAMVNRPTFAGLQGAERKNAMATFGGLGAALGLALGLAAGLARRSTRSALIAGVAGLALGAALGAGASAAFVPIYHAEERRDKEAVAKDLMVPLLVHAGIWAGVGLAAGAALAIGAGTKGRAASVVLSGMVGAALGAAVYEVVAALISPEGRTYQPISTSWQPRLLAATLCPILASALAVFALVSPAREKGRAPAPAPPVSEVTT